MYAIIYNQSEIITDFEALQTAIIVHDISQVYCKRFEDQEAKDLFIVMFNTPIPATAAGRKAWLTSAGISFPGNATAAQLLTLINNYLFTADYPVVWEVGKAMIAGDMVLYENKWYQVYQSHTAQADWTPPVSPALFIVPKIPGTAWVQPLGAHDAYTKNMTCSHNNKNWRSLINANVWEPGVTGWAEITPAWPQWVQPTGAHDAYNKGDRVIFEGALWESLINANVWSPAVYPAGWLFIMSV